MSCTLWLEVSKGIQNAATELWSRSFPGEPLVGEAVTLFPSEDDPEDGPTGDVRRRWWSATGELSVGLRNVVVDPDPDQPVDWRHASSWFTDRDGDLAEGLRRGGWRTWADRNRGTEPEPKDPNVWVCPLGDTAELCKLTHDHYPRGDT